MNALLSPQPSHFPHHHNTARLSPTSGYTYGTMGGSAKRKATDDLDHFRVTLDDGNNDDTSMSPSPSPAISSRQLARPMKKVRSNQVQGRPLVLPRLLETLDADSLRSVLQSICNRHPEIGQEVVTSAPKPSVNSALEVLDMYQQKLQAAFPYGGGSNDYTYNRVRGPLTALIDALTDFTPQYLPPNETQVTNSLAFLDGATAFIHELPDWETSAHRYHKDNAYDDMSQAWALVINEGSKRAGGMQLLTGGWDQKLVKHNDLSRGKMQGALNAMGSNLGWMGGQAGGPTPSPAPTDRESIRNQLFSGTYGNNLSSRPMVGL